MLKECWGHLRETLEKLLPNGLGNNSFWVSACQPGQVGIKFFITFRTDNNVILDLLGLSFPPLSYLPMRSGLIEPWGHSCSQRALCWLFPGLLWSNGKLVLCLAFSLLFSMLKSLILGSLSLWVLGYICFPPFLSFSHTSQNIGTFHKGLPYPESVTWFSQYLWYSLIFC